MRRVLPETSFKLKRKGNKGERCENISSIIETLHDGNNTWYLRSRRHPPVIRGGYKRKRFDMSDSEDPEAVSRT
jgi:hypothetical protein